MAQRSRGGVKNSYSPLQRGAGALCNKRRQNNERLIVIDNETMRRLRFAPNTRRHFFSDLPQVGRSVSARASSFPSTVARVGSTGQSV